MIVGHEMGLDRTWVTEKGRDKGCSRTFIFHRPWPAGGEQRGERSAQGRIPKERTGITITEEPRGAASLPNG